MVTSWIIIGLLIYWSLGFLGYYLIRRRFIKRFSPILGSEAWIRSDAFICITCALFAGPLFLLPSLLFLATTSPKP